MLTKISDIEQNPSFIIFAKLKLFYIKMVAFGSVICMYLSAILICSRPLHVNTTCRIFSSFSFTLGSFNFCGKVVKIKRKYCPIFPNFFQLNYIFA